MDTEPNPEAIAGPIILRALTDIIPLSSVAEDSLDVRVSRKVIETAKEYGVTDMEDALRSHLDLGENIEVSEESALEGLIPYGRPVLTASIGLDNFYRIQKQLASAALIAEALRHNDTFRIHYTGEPKEDKLFGGKYEDGGYVFRQEGFHYPMVESHIVEIMGENTKEVSAQIKEAKTKMAEVRDILGVSSAKAVE